MSKGVSNLEDHVGYWLRFVSNAVSGAFGEKLAAKDVSVAEWVVMRELLGRPGMAPSELAERLNMTRGAITKIVDRLGAKGLAERSSEGSDRRYQALTLTAAGKRLVPALAALADKNDAEFFGHLSAAQRNQLIAMMRDIVQRRGLAAIPTD